MYRKGIMAVGMSAFMLSGCVSGESKDSRENVEKRIDAIYQHMSQDERIAQLHGIYMTQFFDENDKLDTAKCRRLIPNGVGHFSQFAMNYRKTPDELRDMVAQMQEWLVNNTPSGIPALLHEEVLSGINGYEATVYPQQIGLACSFNPQLARQKTEETAIDLRKVGGAQALSPMVDVVRTPSFNRLEESYGEDAFLSASMGTAFVVGLQRSDLREGVAACSKHFLGYGGGGNADEKELMEEILLPHETIIRVGGSKVVMTGYHQFRDAKCVANKELQEDILRNYLGFDGLLVSDYNSIEQIDDKLDSMACAVLAINAGNDVDFPEGKSYKFLKQAVESGAVSQETLEKAVKRVLRHKERLGLLDKDAKLYENGHIEWDSKQNRETAYKLATQSVVLLKNNGILPLSSPKKIALVGPNANSMWAMLGDYSYHSMRFFWKKEIEDNLHPRIVSLKDGMESSLPQGSSVKYSRGCDWTEVVETVVEQGGDPRVAYMQDIQNRKAVSGEEANLDEALKLASESDVIVAAVGENVMLCGENRDRTTLKLPGKQQQFVEKLIATGKPVVLVMFGGRAQVISEIADKCAAVIQAWYPGEEGGNAVADIIYGKVNPSGKLSVSYPAVEIKEPICYNRSVEKDSRIAYPFGFGLSYTSFEYSDASSRQTSARTTDDGDVAFSVDVKNTGAVEGDEIVQLYISPADSSANIRPIQLQGFARVSLKPGEKATVVFHISPQQFGFYSNSAWNIAPGKFTVKFASSSQDIRQSVDFELVGETRIMDLRTSYFPGTEIVMMKRNK
ncbi:MAG: glycoside hydrolase family 3 C-terminal domain-containing protein [Paludibacteraceae bacterium]|nr:glycoside hydrolase family 3 C-terminal domain-containing protein [Paludibacteraceae bacterium]